MASSSRDESGAPPAAGGSSQGLKSWLSPRALVGSAFRLAVVGGLVVAIGGAILVGALLKRPRRAPPEPPTVARAMAAMDRGKLAEARRIAEALEQQGGLSTEEWGGPPLVLGVEAFHAAEQASEKDKPERYRAAAQWLQEARKRGFPEGREAEGLYLLGVSLFRSGAMTAARPVLEEALQADADHKPELHRMLAEVMVADSGIPLGRALAENTAYLADEDLSAMDREEGLIQRAQIQLRQGHAAECAATLAKIPRNTHLRGEIAVLRGRMLYREAKAIRAAGSPPEKLKLAKEKFREAIDLFRAAQGLDSIESRATRQAMYLIGLGLIELGEDSAALTHFGRVGKLMPDSVEGIASAFQEAELARRAARDSLAINAYRRVLKSITSAEEFHNPWLSLKELQTAVLAACQDYIASGKFDAALALSRCLSPLFPQNRALEMRAGVHRTWAQNLLDQAESLPPDRAEKFRAQARAQFRHAGEVYNQLAEIEFTTRHYPEQLWLSASAYLQGHDYQSAVRLLRMYLQNEARQRHSQGLVDLGEALLELGRWDDALLEFQQCIDQHPRDAAAYRARLLASKAAAATGNFKQAEAFLQENLGGEHLTPASKEWRESLFALGELLHQQGRYAEAIRRLEEATTRYPNVPQATQAHYLTADAARNSALALQAELAAEVSAARRAEQEAESRRLLEKALNEYRLLAESLGRRDSQDMTRLERNIVRNCRFAVGEMQFCLGRYEEAAKSYSAAANQYPNNPEVLDAYVQLANVYRRMDRQAEARASLEQAKVALDRIPKDARFEDATNYNRQQWGQVLDWMCSL
jgi:TolA-binding protein